MADSPRLETTQNAIDRLEAGHDGWRVYVAAEVWFARRTGPLTDQERRTRPQSPLEAAGPDELSALITEAEADDTAQDEPAEAGELDAWTTYTGCAAETPPLRRRSLERSRGRAGTGPLQG